MEICYRIHITWSRFPRSDIINFKSQRLISILQQNVPGFCVWRDGRCTIIHIHLQGHVCSSIRWGPVSKRCNLSSIRSAIKGERCIFVTVVSQSFNSIGTSICTPETWPLVCNFVALTSGKVTTESFVAATGTSWSNNFTIKCYWAIRDSIIISSHNAGRCTYHSYKRRQYTFFIVIILISS